MQRVFSELLLEPPLGRRRKPASRPIRILALDGGGTRGVIPATLLCRLEELSGARIIDMFDMVAGSSAGAVLALLLTTRGFGRSPRYSAQDCRQIWVRDSRRIFSRSLRHTLASMAGLYRYKFPIASVLDTLRDYFGDTELKDLLREVLLTSYDVDRHRPSFFTRRAARADGSANFYSRDAAQAAFAAPSWFPSVHVRSLDWRTERHLVDGGVYANNPAGCALAEARALWPKAEIIVVSLGTGQGPAAAYSAGPAGLLGWAHHAVGLMFDAQAGVIDAQMSRLLERPDGTSGYFRLQPDLPRARTRVDNVDPSNIAALERIADEYVDRRLPEIERLCRRLMGDPVPEPAAAPALPQSVLA